jgi:uncharacterized protein (TIGR02996 family)
MSDGDQLLEVIRTHPDDDLTRLAFADWCDEQGAPARAEFIRVQVALARLTPDDPLHPILAARSRGLLLEHEPRWAAPLVGMPASWEFRRGFLETVSLGGPLSPECWQALLAWGLVRCLHVTDWNYLPVDLESVHWRSLRSLDLSGISLFAARTRVRTLLQSPLARHLTGLMLRLSPNRRKALRLLFGSHLADQLTELRAGDSHLTDEAVSLLLASPMRKKLEYLDLSRNRLTSESARMLAQADLPALHTLVLSSNQLGTDGLLALAASSRLERLERLDLSNNGIDDAGVIGLTASPRLPRLRSLSLDSNEFDLPIGLRLLASSHRGELRELSLASGHPFDQGDSPVTDRPLPRPRSSADLVHLNVSHWFAYEYLEDFLARPPCQRLGGLDLNLRNHRIGSTAMAALARSDLLGRLAHLDLSECLLGPEAGLVLAESPRLANLRSLRLANNQFDDRVVQALAASPYLAGLTSLDLSRNRCGDEGAFALARSPHLSNPVIVNLADNPIGDAGREALFRAALRHLQHPLDPALFAQVMAR